ncbi:MAG TPA: hypothetical protein VNG11_05625, partial [Chloroflexota bacterium]|nr:hypothetical protein [Chloroflexota bacterium]
AIFPLGRRTSVLAALFALLASLVATTVSADTGSITLGFVHRDSAHSAEALNSFAFGEDVYLTGSGLSNSTDYYRIVDLQTGQQLAWGEIKSIANGEFAPTLIWRNPDVAGDTFQVQIGISPFPPVGQYDSGLNSGYIYDAPSARVAPIPIATADFYVTPPGMDVPEVPTPAVYLLGLGLVGGLVWWRRRRELMSSRS